MMKWWMALLSVGLVFALFRLTAMQAQLDRMGTAVASLESRDPLTELEALPGGLAARLDTAPKVVVVGPDGGVSRRGLSSLVREAVQAERRRAPAAPAQAPVDAQQILEVVKRDQAQVMERHLNFHKERWLSSREKALDDFSERVGLSPVQRSRLDTLVRDEVEHMADMFRQPRYRDHPEAFASEWEATLNATDHTVAQFLDPEQLKAWHAGRAYERKTLFPWLER